MPDEAEIEARQMKSIKNDCFGEKMPAETMLMFKGIISLPNMDEEPFEEIEFIEPELGKIGQAVEQVKKYNLEGQPWLRKQSKKKSAQSFFSDNNPQNKPIVSTTMIRRIPEFDPTIPPPQIRFHQ
uniref:Uncharacterized protein n=1 Tax=Panagrolaimus sp. JU765 TaxID=591449 RepID=A0AC34Q108_9BILA